MDELFRIDTEVTFKCAETEDEPLSVRQEFSMKVSCVINNPGDPIS